MLSVLSYACPDNSLRSQASEPRALSVGLKIQIQRMLEATKCQSHPIDRHFLLLQIVSATYKQRKDPVHRRLLYEYAAIHVQEFETLAPLLRAEFGCKLPVVPTFQYLATTLTEDKRFDEAIEACEFALRHGLIDGTKSGFEGRISRINKKRAKG